MNRRLEKLLHLYVVLLLLLLLLLHGQRGRFCYVEFLTFLASCVSTLHLSRYCDVIVLSLLPM